MRGSASGTWVDRAQSKQRFARRIKTRFGPAVDFRAFEALPEGFISLAQLLQNEDARPDDGLLTKARAELVLKRGISGLARLRLEAGLSQAELAQRIGTSQPRLSQWERGDEKPNIESLKKLREALSVSYDRIMECF